MQLIDSQEYKDSLKKVVRALQGWRWCLIGGRAVEVHSNPPQTPDIDVLVAVDPQQKKMLVKRISAEGFELDTRLDDEDDSGEFPMLFFTDTNGVEFDVVGAFEDIHFWAIDRALAQRVGGLRIPVATAEDVVILKAQAVLARNDDRKSRDIAAIRAIATSVELDTDYIATALSEANADMSEESELLQKLGVLR